MNFVSNFLNFFNKEKQCSTNSKKPQVASMMDEFDHLLKEIALENNRSKLKKNKLPKNVIDFKSYKLKYNNR